MRDIIRDLNLATLFAILCAIGLGILAATE